MPDEYTPLTDAQFKAHVGGCCDASADDARYHRALATRQAAQLAIARQELRLARCSGDDIARQVALAAMEAVPQ